MEEPFDRNLLGHLDHHQEKYFENLETFQTTERFEEPQEWYRSFENGSINFFENKITINFIHRFLTLITIIIVIFIWLKLLLTYKKDTLVRHHFLILCVFLQFLIGVVLVTNSVPNYFAILHHIGALVLITSAIYSFHGETYGAKK